MAKTRWIRMFANMSLGAYEIHEATANLPEPDWPDVTFNQVLEIAFVGHHIRDLDHPIRRGLRGDT